MFADVRSWYDGPLQRCEHALRLHALLLLYARFDQCDEQLRGDDEQPLRVLKLLNSGSHRLDFLQS